jgi:succinyl-CoA synthetase beta subunit
MRLLEFEAKLLLAEAGIATPPELVTASAAEAAAFARTLGAPVVLKAQVPVGGRMKAGGVGFASDPDRAAVEAGQLLGMTIKGYTVERIAVQEQIAAGGSFYVAATFGAARRSALLLGSAEGGIEIEAAGRVFQQPFSLRQPFPLFRARELAAQMLHAAAMPPPSVPASSDVITSGDHVRAGTCAGTLMRSGALAGEQAASLPAAQPAFDGALQPLTDVIYKLVHFFLAHDALLAEINPLLLVIRPGAAPVFVAVDAHVELDDDALFRRRALAERFGLSGRGERKRTPLEQRAAEIDGADHRGVAGRVVEFEGDLALLIGGGGASLTIFDAILDAGGKPANYCEIGGNPSVWKIAELTKLLLGKPGVTRLAVIMNVVNNTRADLVARGVIKGIVESGREPSEVIAAFRIPGSWEEEGIKILRRYNVRYYGREVSLNEMAQRVVNP